MDPEQPQQSTEPQAAPAQTTPSSGWYTHPTYTGKQPAKISVGWTVAGLFFKFWRWAIIVGVFLFPVAIRLYFDVFSPQANTGSQLSSPTASPTAGQVVNGVYWNHKEGFSVQVNTAQYKVVDKGGNCTAIIDTNTVDDCSDTALPTMIHTDLGWSLSSYRILTGVDGALATGGEPVLFGNTTGTLYPLVQVQTGKLSVFKQVARAAMDGTSYTVSNFHNYTEPVNQKTMEDDFKRFLAGLNLYGKK